MVLTDSLVLQQPGLVHEEQRAVLAYDRNDSKFRAIVSRDQHEVNERLVRKGRRHFGLRGAAHEAGHWTCEVTREEFAALLDQAYAVRDVELGRGRGGGEEVWGVHVGLSVLHRDVEWETPAPQPAGCVERGPAPPEKDPRFAEITGNLWKRIDALPLKRLGDKEAPAFVQLPTRKLPALRIATRRALRERFAGELDLNRTSVTGLARSEWSVSIPLRERGDRYYRVEVNLGGAPIVVASRLLKP